MEQPGTTFLKALNVYLIVVRLLGRGFRDSIFRFKSCYTYAGSFERIPSLSSAVHSVGKAKVLIKLILMFSSFVPVLLTVA